MASDKFVGPMTAPIPLLKRLVTLTAQLNEAGGTFLTEAEANALYLKQASNLSDLSNAGTARTNLGLGTAAVQNVEFFLQAANNLSDVANAGTARTNIGLGALDSPTFAGLTLSSPLTVGNGGTGLSAIADASVLVTNAANTLSVLTAAAGQSIRRNAGNTAWEAYTPAGGATLDAVSAAVGNQAGISNGNFNIRWNWAKTTDGQTAFEFGESAASTGGTSTSGVPNQVIGKFSTLAASTASPLSVYSRAAHVFSVSPSTAQILAADGSAAAPTYSFASASTTGFYGGSTLRFSVAGIQTAILTGSNFRIVSGSATVPAITDLTSSNTGLFWPATDTIGIANTTDGEWIRWSSFVQQVSRAGANTTAYAINARKSRGTVASPTVITTGDDLLKIGAFGYVGATNTYVEAANITFDSTGTITDSSTGVGGIIRFNTRAVGGAVTEAFNVQGGATPQILAANGSAGSPIYSFNAGTGWGLFRETAGFTKLGIAANGGSYTSFADGAANTLNITDSAGTFITGAQLNVVSGGASTINAMLLNTRTSVDAATIQGRKSRGGVAAPSVITTGDSLFKASGHGYVGATNQFVEAANITFDSTGTISDTSTGVGGVIRFNTRVSGSAIAEAANIIGTVLNVASSVATPAGGSTSARLIFGTTSGFGIYYGSGAPSVSAAQGSLYLRSDGSSTSTRLYVNTDGATAWTNFTSAT